MFNSFNHVRNTYCNHITIGSSNVYRLMKGSLNAMRVHNAERILNAHNIGSLWEHYVANLKTFKTNDNSVIKYDVV